ncbi:hypothetical protein ABZ371_28190 [Streptomyces sp. NPDC005899]|uniref:hypothetical protein n=1 Tax=Streptomyces sp. NPDC005899 TaxID=3155716 RepID=UPI0033CC2E1C
MGTLKTVRHRRAAAALLLPALIGAAGCGTGDRPDAGRAVYGLPLAEQFQAATDATRGAGTAAFVSTLTYGAAGGDAVQRAEGTQDYARGTSRVDLVFGAGRRFPARSLAYLRQSAPDGRQTLATADEDVYVRQGTSAWLKYTPEAVNALGEATGVIAAHAAGDAAPYSGTLADLVPRVIPREKPERREDGSRVYRVTVLPEVAAELLPRDLQSLQQDWGAEPVRLTVRLDSHGRLASATADLTPVLARLHEREVLADVTRLRAEYRIGAFGEPVKGKGPEGGGEPVKDARTVLVALAAIADGRCADAGGTGLGTVAVARPVDCADRHDLRVVSQVEVDRTFPGEHEDMSAYRYGLEQCHHDWAAAPDAWERGTGAPEVIGTSDLTVSTSGGASETAVTGRYTCYVTSS